MVAVLSSTNLPINIYDWASSGCRIWAKYLAIVYITHVLGSRRCYGNIGSPNAEYISVLTRIASISETTPAPCICICVAKANRMEKILYGLSYTGKPIRHVVAVVHTRFFKDILCVICMKNCAPIQLYINSKIFVYKSNLWELSHKQVRSESKARS